MSNEYKYVDFLNGASNVIQNIGKALQLFVERTKPIVDMVGDIGRTFGERLKKYSEMLADDSKFDSILLQLKWVPIRVLDYETKKVVISFYDNSEFDKLIEYLNCDLVEKLDDEYFDNLIIDWFENHMLDTRNDLLLETIECHKTGKYFASTILAISQIEGIIADGFYHKGQMREKKYKRYISELYEASPNDEAEAFKRFFMETVLIGFEHGKSCESDLSRHAIMHGADTTYGTKINSLRAILLLDYLQDRVSYFHIENSKVFHKHGYHYLEKTNKEIICTKNIKILITEGYKPCEKCMKYS